VSRDAAAFHHYTDQSFIVSRLFLLQKDILSDEIRKKGKGVKIASGNVGSLGGLMALRKKACHMAGSHLLDTNTGEYNTPYIKRYLKGMPVHVFNLVAREQGLITQKGNPKGIEGIEPSKDNLLNFRRKKLFRVMRKYKVTAYFCGHTHLYGVAEKDGIIQICNGSGARKEGGSYIMVFVDGKRY